VELVVRLVPGGIGSTHLHRLDVGDRVVFTGPYGDFRLNEDPDVPVVCVGGGCGMAPMRNIIRHIHHTWPERECWLFFGARRPEDVFYLQEFELLAAEHERFHCIYALSDPLAPGDKWDGETGFIHLAVDKYLPEGRPAQAFLCGPPLMIEAVTDVLRDKGLADEDIFYDEF
jgi:Na+-transporting NADH:ubiquinone oxidoreductase subunit F